MVMKTAVRLITTSDVKTATGSSAIAGWIFVNRERIEASDPKLLKEPLSKDAHPPVRIQRSHGQFHGLHPQPQAMQICDVEVGYRSVSICHLGVIALRLGIPLYWDPAAQAVRRPAGRERQRHAFPRHVLAVEA